MSWNYGWRPYVPVAQRRAKAARELAKLGKTTGRRADPVVLAGRTIAASFWGKAWCDHLEAYSDFANRLPRGRTYVRNGSVVDLRIERGSVTARVSGSDLYQVTIAIRPLAPNRWEAVRKECAGKIDSILELLQGRLSAAVLRIVTRRDEGLFPAPGEIEMECSCPDWAGMCKHVAATLYGVGARLDSRPELLFLLRGVDPEDLIAGVTGSDAVGPVTSPEAGAGLDPQDLSAVFGIEIDAATPVKPSAAPAPRKPSTPAAAAVAVPGEATPRARRSPKRPKAKAARPGKSAPARETPIRKRAMRRSVGQRKAGKS